MIRVYDYPLSGNCYKVRLLLGILGVSAEYVAVDFFPGRAHRHPDFLQINPLGQIPVMEDGDLRLRDAQAILVYLAAKYDGTGQWYPRDAQTLGKVSMWLAFADRITATASAARLHDGMHYDFDIAKCRADAHALFRVLDEHLWFAEAADSRWIATKDHPTIADIACFPYVMLSEEGGIPREDYPAIRRWTDRVKAINGFITMPGIFPL
ncbi:MAG: glutathione S-transferase family protein [Burkholderiales bacterium]